MGISKICVIKNDCFTYPSKEELFRPATGYPEYKLEKLSSNNRVYEMVRESFHLLGMDETNYGTEKWNPLGELVKPGQNVLIKPNLVMHLNAKPENGTDCLYTNPSVVAAIVDYVWIALKGKGKIIIGDAPVQECDFDELLRTSGYLKLVEWYKSLGINVEIIDFRGLVSEVSQGIRIQHINEEAKGILVDLGGQSEFVGEGVKYDRLRITNYAPSFLSQHHSKNKNEYLISDYVLNADVIINVPKPKAHRLGGVTISLKNLIGVNVRKEYLPHHTLGAKEDGGDEYQKHSSMKSIYSKLTDRINTYAYQRKMTHVFIFRIVRKLVSFLKGDGCFFGAWYGNETISKTIVDINKIIYYADKNGNLCKDATRKVFIVADMIVCGEKEGPLAPSPKKVGVIAAGYNPVCFDEAIATLMGFDKNKIPTLKLSRGLSGDFCLCDPDLLPCYVSNDEAFNLKSCDEIRAEDTFAFKPSAGWINHIELK